MEHSINHLVGKYMDPIVRLAAIALPDEKKYILFAGAGVSKDAGVPTAWDIMLATAKLLYVAAHNDQEEAQSNPSDADIEKWFVNSPYAQMEYAELIEKLYPFSPEQQSFMDGLLADKPVGKAHHNIAELAKRGIIRAIVTVNFDPYIEEALQAKGLRVQVISTDEDLSNSEPLIQCKAVRVYKPHGTLGRGQLKNTPKDLQALSPAMHQELVRVLSEHGVIVLGYSGRDEGIRKAFEERRYTLYPLFWVNRRTPQGPIADLLDNKGYTFIKCMGASQFIDDFLQLQERLDALTSAMSRSKTTLSDLQLALAPTREPVAEQYADYLAGVMVDLKQCQPDSRKANTAEEEPDEAIVRQIENGLPITHRFLEAALLASRYDNADAISALYEFFGQALPLAIDQLDPSTPSSGPFENDGYRFLLYEMFVGFVASLIKFDRWAALGKVLSDKLYVRRQFGESKYVTFTDLNNYIESIDVYRNERKKREGAQGKVSIVADVLEHRFTQTSLAGLITFEEFMEADHFLFTCSITQADDVESLRDTWCPKSGVYFLQPPNYILRAQSSAFLDVVAQAANLPSGEVFLSRVKSNYVAAVRDFRIFGPGSSTPHRVLFDTSLEKVGTL